MNRKLVFFDLKTGGLDPQKHAITQLAAVAVGLPLVEATAHEQGKESLR